MQSKLKRTKQSYVPQFEALKALTTPEVSCSLSSRMRSMLHVYAL